MALLLSSSCHLPHLPPSRSETYHPPSRYHPPSTLPDLFLGSEKPVTDWFLAGDWFAISKPVPWFLESQGLVPTGTGLGLVELKPKSDSGAPSNKEDPDAIRKPKRQRNCLPPPLDSVVLRGSSNSGGFSSFTFDTKIADDWTPETTPRFGSFNGCVKAGKVRGDDRIEGRKQGEVMMVSDGDDDNDTKRSLG
nr:hypothetical protein DM860_000931 [Ipomoea batatas]